MMASVSKRNIHLASGFLSIDLHLSFGLERMVEGPKQFEED